MTAARRAVRTAADDDVTDDASCCCCCCCCCSVACQTARTSPASAIRDRRRLEAPSRLRRGSETRHRETRLAGTGVFDGPPAPREVDDSSLLFAGGCRLIRLRGTQAVGLILSINQSINQFIKMHISNVRALVQIA